MLHAMAFNEGLGRSNQGQFRVVTDVCPHHRMMCLAVDVPLTATPCIKGAAMCGSSPLALYVLSFIFFQLWRWFSRSVHCEKLI